MRQCCVSDGHGVCVCRLQHRQLVFAERRAGPDGGQLLLSELPPEPGTTGLHAYQATTAPLSGVRGSETEW